MNEDRITHYEKGFSVKIDWESVDRITEIIDDEFKKHKFITADCLTALSILTIETAYNSKINKPQFLAKISQWWEELDQQVHDK